MPVWLDDDNRPAARRSLESRATTDLAVVGGGYSGLWTAVLAKQRDPGRRVVLLEAETIGWAASGRNGGFCEASLTHGRANGLDRFPDEYDTLERLGDDNLAELRADVERHGIDCNVEPTGQLSVATEEYQIAELREAADDGAGEFFDRDQVRAEVDSPTYLAGLWSHDTVMVHPARLAWGLADAAESLGVEVFEHSRVERVRKDGSRIELTTNAGTIVADQVALGTNAFPSLIRRVRPYIVPVYDYALATEPLDDDRLASIGWKNRQGIGDSANQFHYYRLTPDNRILFGGYDAIYYFGRRISPSLDQRQQTFELLSEHFFETFPQLAGVRFTHAWGGAIDLCARFCAFYGTAYSGRVAYATGYTGLGVGATRFGANVMLDLLEGVKTERTETAMVQSKPVPFPPEPLAWIGVTATRAAIKQADRNEGRRNLWLRTLDRLGLGFDS
ncbi:MAG TPA: FAD-dependent oxidoreductase [Nocardioidaceae bacterium]|nr:FAD-dependent oxidoreductase [Nocardioidaceae bacterium]